MIESPDILLDLTEYRSIAGYVLALIMLQRTRRIGSLGMKLKSRCDAAWLASRLRNQGYTVAAIETREEQAVLKICKTA